MLGTIIIVVSNIITAGLVLSYVRSMLIDAGVYVAVRAHMYGLRIENHMGIGYRKDGSDDKRVAKFRKWFEKFEKNNANTYPIEPCDCEDCRSDRGE